MKKRTQLAQPQLSLLLRVESAARPNVDLSAEQKRELVRSLAELLVQAAHVASLADTADAAHEEQSDE